MVGQLSLDMVRYQKELSEVFQDEIVAHHKVERDVEVVSNELENMFAIEAYLQHDRDLQEQIQRNAAIQNEIASYNADVDFNLDTGRGSVRARGAERLQRKVLDDLLNTDEVQTRQEMAVRLAQARTSAMISTAENATLRRRLLEVEAERNFIFGKLADQAQDLALVGALDGRGGDDVNRIVQGLGMGEPGTHQSEEREPPAARVDRNKSDRQPTADARESADSESDDDASSISDFMFSSKQREVVLKTPVRDADCQTENGSESIQKGGEEPASEAEAVGERVNQKQPQEIGGKDADPEIDIDEADKNEEETALLTQDKPPATPVKDADCQTNNDDEPAQEVEIVSQKEPPATPVKDADCQTNNDDESVDNEASTAAETEEEAPVTPVKDADCQTNNDDESVDNEASTAAETEEEAPATQAKKDADLQTESVEAKNSSNLDFSFESLASDGIAGAASRAKQKEPFQPFVLPDPPVILDFKTTPFSEDQGPGPEVKSTRRNPFLEEGETTLQPFKYLFGSGSPPLRLPLEVILQSRARAPHEATARQEEKVVVMPRNLWQPMRSLGPVPGRES